MPLINLERIKAHRLETDPYRWTAITDLYTPDDAENWPRLTLAIISSWCPRTAANGNTYMRHAR